MPFLKAVKITKSAILTKKKYAITRLSLLIYLNRLVLILLEYSFLIIRKSVSYSFEKIYLNN